MWLRQLNPPREARIQPLSPPCSNPDTICSQENPIGNVNQGVGRLKRRLAHPFFSLSSPCLSSRLFAATGDGFFGGFFFRFSYYKSSKKEPSSPGGNG